MEGASTYGCQHLFLEVVGGSGLFLYVAHGGWRLFGANDLGWRRVSFVFLGKRRDKITDKCTRRIKGEAARELKSTLSCTGV